MSGKSEKLIIPSVRDVRKQLAENVEDSRILRRQLRVSEAHAAEERRRQELGIARFRHMKEGES
jgi:hypothetical protein